MKKSKLLIIGDNCFDIVVRGRFKFERDRNNIPIDYEAKPGGTGVNFAVSFAQLFGDAYYFTPISLDSFGEEILQFLNSKNVSVYDKRSKKKTALTISMIDELGERITFGLLKDTAYTDISIEEFKKVLPDFDSVYISGGINSSEEVQRSIIKIAEITVKKGAKLFFDPQIRIGKSIPNFIETANKIAEMSNIIFANENELKEMNIPKDTFIVEKRGSSGAVAFFESKKFSANGIKVKAMSTVGAGDIFNAAFLAYYLNGKSIANALKFANYAAAFSVTKKNIYTPTSVEVEEFIKNYFRRNLPV